jgi:hypothetical protein
MTWHDMACCTISLIGGLHLPIHPSTHPHASAWRGYEEQRGELGANNGSYSVRFFLGCWLLGKFVYSRIVDGGLFTRPSTILRQYYRYVAEESFLKGYNRLPSTSYLSISARDSRRILQIPFFAVWKITGWRHIPRKVFSCLPAYPANEKDNG